MCHTPDLQQSWHRIILLDSAKDLYVTPAMYLKEHQLQFVKMELGDCQCVEVRVLTRISKIKEILIHFIIAEKKGPTLSRT